VRNDEIYSKRISYRPSAKRDRQDMRLDSSAYHL
jgi:hypothetical protein